MLRPAPSGIVADRLARVREALVKHKLDAYLVWNRNDQYWLTCFTGEDGGVLVTNASVTLITDGRFGQNADEEAPWAKKVLRVKRGPESVAKVLKASKARRIGFDPNHVSVALYTALSKLLRPAKLVGIPRLVGEMRQVKSVEEVTAIREAIRIAQEAFTTVRPEIRFGRSELDIAAKLTYEMNRLGARESAFSPIVAAGPNAALPHYASGKREIGRDDFVLIDWGARPGWYVSDLTRMVPTGSIPPELRKAYEVVREAHDAAISALRPRAKAADIDRVARKVITKAGLGDRFTHALGHGIGLDVHEAPRLGRGSEDVLVPGMVVTIEPGVYLPGIGGVRIESDVLITDSGCEVLSSLPVDEL